MAVEIPFLQEQFIDGSVCDGVIKYFNDNPENLIKGRSVLEGLESKQSIDMSIDSVKHPAIKLFADELQKCLNKYIEVYKYAGAYAGFELAPFNIQYCKPGDSYNSWHTERGGRLEETIRRHLAFMLYCNDVEIDGETEFFHQKYKCKPEKGKLVIWPTDWTFTHRGIPAPNEEKYIVTGWFDYLTVNGC